jgi:two-component system cell cycle sensor histidine kinase/response regulator CckA
MKSEIWGPHGDATAFRLLFETNPHPVWVFDLSTLRIVDANAACEAFSGYTRDELLLQTVLDLLPPEGKAAFLAQRGSLPERNRTVWRMRCKDGSDVWIEIDGQDMPGPERRRLVIGRDITNERRALQALQQSQDRLQRLTSAGIIGMIVTESSGLIREANDAFLTLLGYTRAELEAGLLRWDRLTPSEWDGVNARLVDELRERSSAGPVEKEYLHKDGNRVPVLIASAALTATLQLTLVVDLTEQRRAEGAMRRSERLFRAIVEASPDGVTLLAADNTVLYMSPAGARIGGRPQAEYIGKRLIDSPMVSDRVAYQREWDRCLAAPGIPQRLQLTATQPDGSVRSVETIRINYLDDPNVGAVVSIIRDLTEQRRLEDQLRHAQKMEAIGNLAGGIAHDFNNLLTVILSYSDGILETLRPADPVYADIEEIQRAGERAASLTRQLLAFSRRQVLNPRVIDLNATLAETEKMIRRLIGEHIELVTLFDPELDKIKVDPTQVEQMLMNLVVNARDAMSQGGKLTIETRNVVLDANTANAVGAPVAGRYALLSITDTGIGITDETRTRIFEPFFTTKKESGTGLGLATVFGIVNQSRGAIAVHSTPGRGTTFRVYLPATTELEPARVAITRESQRLRGAETILVAEDEEQVRTLVREVLRRKGYDVLAASSPGEALLIAERHPGPIHLLLTDLVMPQISGRELAGRLAVGRPNMQVLYMSGYTEDEEIQRQVDEGRAVFLPKPVTPEVLLRTVRELLDSRATGGVV